MYLGKKEWNSRRPYSNAACRPAERGASGFCSPLKSQTNWSRQSSNSRLLPLVVNASLLSLAHSIAGARFLFSFNSCRTKYILANCFRTWSDGTPSISRSVVTLSAALESGLCCEVSAFLSDSSERNVAATENWPSRRRCIAMARLIRCSWDDRESCSILGSGLSLKNYSQPVSKQHRQDMVRNPDLTLSRTLLYLFRLLWLSLRLSLIVSNDDFTGF